MIKGNISIKRINGKTYYVHQYRDGNKVINRSINKDEAFKLSFETNYAKKYDLNQLYSHNFNTDVNYGSSLYSLIANYPNYKKRFLFDDIHNFLFDTQMTGKVLALYGLRRTGKTTLIFQSIIDMDLSDFSKAAYIRISSKDSFYSLKEDLEFLTLHGFKYIFIDEITLLEDFISMASVLSDIFGLRSKVVLSGTDSLGFMIAKYNELFDRVIMLHTTYISFKEFAAVLDIDSIDKYIEYGGTMSLEGVDYNAERINGGQRLNEYVDSAIAHNIEHSLKYYHDGDHFFSLYSLFEKGELTNVINRLVEDVNHRFAISVIERAFKSHDYGSLKQLISKQKEEDISSSLKNVNEDELLKTLMDSLAIINREEQKHKIDDNVIKEIEEYLDILDLCKTIDVVNSSTFVVEKRKVFIQPGLRYAQAKALLEALMSQEGIRSLPLKIRNIVEDKLLSDIKGRMLEEIVLYQSSVANKDTFKLLFPIGEIDMVTLNNNDETTNIYEIKYSKSINSQQYNHLHNKDYLTIVENAYYPIKEKIVLYKGEDTLIDDIQYRNVEKYLKAL